MHHTLTGNFRQHSRFQSRFVEAERDIIVYLPPCYDEEPERRYPVCYFHDGQNLFDSATAFGGNEWGLDEAAECLIREGQIEPCILVGIYNTGVDRMHEYTHVQSASGHGGRAKDYGRMIVRELIPFINREYRTVTGPACTGLGGSSLGGLATVYLGLLYPKVFGKLIVMSPSVWWARRAILRNVRAVKSKHGQKIWLDTGTAEGTHPETTVQDAEALRDALIEKGWQLDRDLMFVEDLNATHDEHAWGRRVRDALRFLFPAAHGRG